MNINTISKASKVWNPKLGCLVATPKDFDITKTYPLIIGLHGTGEGGSILSDLKLAGIMKEIAAGKEISAIVITPQFPTDNDWWNEIAIDWIYTMVKDPNFLKEYSIDPNSISCTGYSAGARGTEMLALRHPDLLACASIVAVRNYDLTNLSTIKDIPFWELSNTANDGSDWSNFISAFTKVGGFVKTTTANGQTTLWNVNGHDAWSQAYKIDELYSWHLSFKKVVVPTPAPEPTPAQPVEITQDVQNKIAELSNLIAGARIYK